MTGRNLIVIALLLIQGCSSKTIKIEEQPEELKKAKTEILADSGEHLSARFSPDSSKLVFIARSHKDNQRAQVYLYNVANKKERRLTFNDAEDAFPRFSPDGKQIIYSSTTDEVKEGIDRTNLPVKGLHAHRAALTNKSSPSPTVTPAPTSTPSMSPAEAASDVVLSHLNSDVELAKGHEIYTARADGSGRQRLTRNQGYDAEAEIIPNGKRVIFTSLRDGELDLFSMDLKGKNQKRLTMAKGPDRFATISKDGKKIAWSANHDETPGPLQLFVGSFTPSGTIADSKQITTKKNIHYIHPTWVGNDSLIFSSTLAGTGHFDVYLLKVTDSCLKRLTFEAGDKTYPAISSDGKWLAYTLEEKGKASQMIIKEFIEPGPCLIEAL